MLTKSSLELVNLFIGQTKPERDKLQTIFYSSFHFQQVSENFSATWFIFS